MKESGAEIALLKKNLMIKTLCRTYIFKSFNSGSFYFAIQKYIFSHLTTARCQYLILVYIIYTC